MSLEQVIAVIFDYENCTFYQRYITRVSEKKYFVTRSARTNPRWPPK